MTDLGFEFDVEGFEPPEDDFAPLPAGDYDIIILSSAMKDTQSGGRMLSLELAVINGPYQHRRIFDNLNLVNRSDKAVAIAKARLQEIGKATGNKVVRDASVFHNKPLRCSIVVKNDKQGQPRNNVKKYMPREAPQAPAPPQSGANPFA